MRRMVEKIIFILKGGEMFLFLLANFPQFKEKQLRRKLQQKFFTELFRYKHLSLKVPNVKFDVSALIRQNLTFKMKI